MELNEEYADVMSIENFNSYRKCGAFIPHDGVGYYGTETHHSNAHSVWGNQPVPEWATHVAWYNR